MKGIGFIALLCLCLCVRPLLAGEGKPLQMKEGEKYQLRVSTSETVYGIKSTNPLVIKRVLSKYYDFSVLKAHRKRGFLIEITKRSDNYVMLAQNQDNALWRELLCWDSDIVSPYREEGLSVNMCPAIDSVCRVELSPDLRVLSFESSCVGTEEDKAASMKEVQAFFSSGKISSYRSTDTSFREQYPEGRVFYGDWYNKVYEARKEERREFKFSRVDDRPFSVICEGDKDQYMVFPETNTLIRGQVKKAGKDTSIRVVWSENFPVYSKKIFRVPVTNGKFEFRMSLSRPVDYLGVGDCYLYLEPGDDLTVLMDSLTDEAPEFTGVGAGNNRYYAGDGCRWGYALYHIDRDKMCSRDYYAKLDEVAGGFRKKMESGKAAFTSGFFQYMQSCFKYRPVYQKLIADADSTVGEFDCMESIEICNPLAVGEGQYMSVLRHIMLLKMPKKLAVMTGKAPAYGSAYDMAVLLLDGKVLNAFLTEFIAEKLQNNFEEGKVLYERYKKDYTSSPYLAALDAQYQKSRLLAVGSIAPDFTVQDVAGNRVSLSDFRGKVVYLDFWSLGCGPCMYEFKKFAPALKEAYKGKDVVFLNLIGFTRNEAEWKRLIKEYRISGINVMDTKGSSVCNVYSVDAFPHYILIGRDGKVIKNDAPRPSEKEALGKLIDEALK